VPNIRELSVASNSKKIIFMMYKIKAKQLASKFRNENDAVNYLESRSIFLREFIATEKEEVLMPKYRDLARLYYACETIKAKNILEYGCGFSSYIFHSFLNLTQNEDEKKRNFQIIEVHENYLKTATDRFEETRNSLIINPSLAKVFLDKSRNDGSHFYDAKYSILPDLIYLDGPDPADINGSCFTNCSQRLPISSDILTIESWLLPGTIVFIDGRVANVRYLQKKLTRDWEWGIDIQNDVSVAILKEEPLGLKSRNDLIQRGLI